MTDANFRDLVCAIILQATKDFFDGTDAQRKAILKDLRSPYMNTLSDGTSVVVAEQLEKHPEDIAARMRQNYKID